MVLIKGPVSGVCSSLGTKARHIRRSASTSSVDVVGSVVSRNIWLFENEAFKKSSTESLQDQAEAEFGNGCCRHIWYLATNFRPSQQCTKCCKRIATKRAIHKCTSCKKVYHLRCSAELDELGRNHNSRTAGEARMDVTDFVTTRRASPHRQPCQVPKTKKRAPFTRLQLNEQNKPLEAEIPESNIDELPYAPEEAIEPDQINTTTASRKSHTKQALAGMKSSFVKRCKSFKDKIKTKKEKHGRTNSVPSSKNNVASERTPELSRQDQAEEKHDAWIKSPARNRIRAKQAEIRAESIRRRARPYVKSKNRKTNLPSENDFFEIQERLEIVEKKLCVLEKAIPMEINKWNELGLKFKLQRDDSLRKEDQYNNQGTRPKELEANGYPSLSSGTTSDELFVVPDASTSSQEDHVTCDHVTKTESQPITETQMTNGFYSSEHDDSSLLPSGIPNKLKLEISGNNSQSYSEHQTSTPVTNCELSFRSASKKYANQIIHKNITRISTETSESKEAMDWVQSDYPQTCNDNEGNTCRTRNKFYEENGNKRRSFEERRSGNGSFERNRSNNRSFEGSQNQNKVLSPEQLAVKYFLQKRRSSSNYQPRSSHRMKLSGSSPIASSTFYNGDGIITADISPVSYTMRHDQSNNSQMSCAKLMNESNQSERRKSGKSSNQNSPISPVISELSYTFRNDSQMIQSAGEENLQGYTTNNFVPGYTTTNFAAAGNAAISESEESLNGVEQQIIVEADIEPDCYVERETLVGCVRDRAGSIDGASLTNVTECSGDDGSSYAEKKDDLHRSRWINKDVHMFGSSGGLAAIQDRKTKSPESRRPGSMDERGDGKKPPLPVRKIPSENSLDLDHGLTKSSSFRRAFSEPKVDFIKEAERHLEQYQSRMRQEIMVGACMDRQSRTSVLEVYSEESEEAIAEEEIIPENRTRNDSYWKTDETHEFEKMEKELKEESIALAKRLSRTRSHPDVTTDSFSPVNEGKYGKSASCTTSISGETRQLINENAKYHFLHEKGMIKISSPGLKIVSETSSSKHTSHRIDDIDEESTDIAESGSETDINDVVINSKFSLFRNNDIPSHSEASIAALDEAERRQKHIEAQIIQDCMATVDSQQAVWDNVQNWMAREGSDAGSEELQAELDKLIQQQQADLHSQSPHEDSVYYSFQGQSEELRNMIRQGDHTWNEREDEIEHIAGLLNVIQHGTISQVEQLLNSDMTISEMEIKEATLWALEQHNFPIACLLLDDICRLLVAAEGDTCKHAYPAYCKGYQWDPLFVVLSNQNFQGEWDLFMGFRVYRRRYDFVSPEAAIVINSDLVRNNPLSLDDFRDVQNAINISCLHKKHSNITVVNACPYRSKRGGEVLEKERCIVVHCLLKGYIPFNEEPFAEEVNGISVDVREGFFQLGVRTPPNSRKNEAQPWDSERSDSDASACMTGSVSDQTMSRSNSGSSAESMSYATPRSVHQQSTVPDPNVDVDGDAVMMGPAGDQQAMWHGGMAGANMIDMLKCLDIEATPSPYPGHKSKDFNTSLRMGTCIGPSTGEGSGTLGGFVLTKAGQLGALTCAHVISGSEGITQPAAAELESESLAKKCLFGTVISHVFDPGSVDDTGVDAAVIHVEHRQPTSGQFIWARKEQLKFAVFEPKSPPRFTKGEVLRVENITPRKRHISVLKYGAETGLTCGKLYLNGQYVRTANREMRLPSSDRMIEFFNQMEIASIQGTSTRFFDLGDSGSLVFMPLNGSELSCIGLCIGCTSYGSCVVTPIEDVLDKLDLPCKFVDFTNNFSKTSK